ncbi:transcriptional regulator [Salmonella enterica]|uniref:Transcriptional regulator n=1 Tax=Salmonella enterica I TaxID=59201 RepID=A0A5U3FRQ5_SALET|nr:transcriptional regulator [Salmonella enterica]EBP4056258.1 transcriptional regulator [Salmonella enterica subsp. enterica]ECE6505232.1 transcriptional regulator [Salmonella enterica subsp. salamae]ECT6596921.1 transcriptional regulator [Salmonella enterica subsp. enterica serovar Ealing]EDI0746319.1 transcriptional regulator [Salmonella enterica subsp. enterica serovar Kisarawe]EDT8570967.1 transcriptional regulator [Salmonella enterica subsp. enterica serovar Eastbourne]
MRTQAVLQKWGNSIALRLTGNLKTVPGFEAGDRVDIEINEAGLSIQKATRPHLSESELLSGLSPYLAHADEMASPMGGEADY